MRPALAPPPYCPVRAQSCTGSALPPYSSTTGPGTPYAGLQQTNLTMARNKSNIETIIIALLLLVGIAGAFFLFSGSEDSLAEPGHSLENAGAVYQQVSMNNPGTAYAE